MHLSRPRPSTAVAMPWRERRSSIPTRKSNDSGLQMNLVAPPAPEKIRRKRAAPESTWRGAMSEGPSTTERPHALNAGQDPLAGHLHPQLPHSTRFADASRPTNLEKPKMSCLACLRYHTDPLAAIACYRKDDGKLLARGVVRVPVLLPRSSPATSPTSDTVFRRGRAGRSGRPKVLVAVQRQKGARP